MISVDAPSSPPLSPKSSQSKDFPEWSSPFLNAYENTDKKMEGTFNLYRIILDQL